jgi:hypothetical protein
MLEDETMTAEDEGAETEEGEGSGAEKEEETNDDEG